MLNIDRKKLLDLNSDFIKKTTYLTDNYCFSFIGGRDFLPG